MSTNHEDTVARADECTLLVVDVQEKLLPLMPEADLLVERIGMLVRGAQAIGVPVIVSEQYPEGLGRTVPGIADLGHDQLFEKTTFSCMRDSGIRSALRESGRHSLVVCGIEAHICVMQTVVDAIEAGMEVYVVEDAIASRLPHALPIGVRRMRQAGAEPATVESMIFEWLERCDRPEFKQLLPLFKEAR